MMRSRKSRGGKEREGEIYSVCVFIGREEKRDGDTWRIKKDVVGCYGQPFVGQHVGARVQLVIDLEKTHVVRERERERERLLRAAVDGH
jgi:hypothetical protein